MGAGVLVCVDQLGDGIRGGLDGSRSVSHTRWIRSPRPITYNITSQGADIDPLLEQRSVDHRGGVNRVRSMPQQPAIVATWADTAHVHIWDVSTLVKAIDQPTGMHVCLAYGSASVMEGVCIHQTSNTHPFPETPPTSISDTHSGHPHRQQAALLVRGPQGGGLRDGLVPSAGGAAGDGRQRGGHPRVAGKCGGVHGWVDREPVCVWFGWLCPNGCVLMIYIYIHTNVPKLIYTHQWQGGENNASWQVLDQKQPYRGHTSSVEDLQWSPTEASGAWAGVWGLFVRGGW